MPTKATATKPRSEKTQHQVHDHGPKTTAGGQLVQLRATVAEIQRSPKIGPPQEPSRAIVEQALQELSWSWTPEHAMHELGISQAPQNLTRMFSIGNRPGGKWGDYAF